MWKYFARKRLEVLLERNGGKITPDMIRWGARSGRYVPIICLSFLSGGNQFFCDTAEQKFYFIDMVGPDHDEWKNISGIENASRGELQYFAAKFNAAESKHPHIAAALVRIAKELLERKAG